MTKTIHFKVSDELYYMLVSLKAQTHNDSWEGLMKHITNPNQLKQPEQPEQPRKQKPTDLSTADRGYCVCGHPELGHDNEGCFGDGGLCACKEFTENKI